MLLTNLSISTNFDSALNALVEDQGTTATVRLGIAGFDPATGLPTFLSEPAPAGGLRVFVDSDVPNILDRFDLSDLASNPQFANIDPASFTTNADNSGFAVTINEGETFGAFNLKVLDNAEPDANLPDTLDGLQEVVFTVKSSDQVGADSDRITGISNYIPEPFALENTVLFADDVSQLPAVAPSQPITPEPTIKVGISLQTSNDGGIATLVENQGTTVQTRFELSEPAPAGGLRVYVETDGPQILDRLDLFDVLRNPRVENIVPNSFASDTDDSGFAVTIEEGATFGVFETDVFDNPEPDSFELVTLDGFLETKLTLKTANDVSTESIEGGFIVGVSDYAIDPAAATSTLRFVDDISQLPSESGAESIDFDTAGTTPLAAGTVITDQFEGLTVSTPDNPNGAMIFDSANPTGGDRDLFAPDLGNILIISEDGDSSDPDDNAAGGVMRFEWDDLVGIASVGMLDIEEPGSSIQLYDESDVLIQSFDIPALGNNRLQTLELGVSDVARMDVVLTGSGALTDVILADADALVDPVSNG